MEWEEVGGGKKRTRARKRYGGNCGGVKKKGTTREVLLGPDWKRKKKYNN